MFETVYVARHGFRLNWVMSHWDPITGTPRDPPLAAYGIAQAEQLASYFSSLPEDQRPTAIFSSPFYRCLQTSTPVAKALGLPLHVEHGIMEWYSPVKEGTGLHPRPGTATSLKAYFPDIDDSYSSTWLPSRLGETPDQVQKRTDDFLEAFAPRFESGGHPPGQHTRILFVGHAASCITLIKSLAGSKAEGKKLRIGCCSVTTLRRDAGAEKGVILGAYDIAGLAEAHFLTNGVERDWGFEDISVDETGRVVDDPGDPGTEGQVEENFGLQISRPSAHM
ncbi:hypothetical protein FRB96_005708 [Tulasnella sp. 330]|nr:hypothetical protein FRB96_005708 [Tulasnella sp. 330]